MLSHRAMMANCVGAYQLLETLGLGDEVFLSFLPLSHSYEHSAGLMFPGRDRRADLLCRGGRDPDHQPRRGAADPDDRGAASLRSDAPTHPRRGQAAERVSRRNCSGKRSNSGANAMRTRTRLASERSCSTDWSNAWSAPRYATASVGHQALSNDLRRKQAHRLGHDLPLDRFIAARRSLGGRRPYTG